MERNILLDVKNCSKSFPGVTALSNFSFDLGVGEIHCLVGENGAGKSTFIKLLSGALRPDGGTLFINDEEHSHLTPALAQQLGIRTIYQEISLAPDLTIAENIFMGRIPTRRFGIVDHDAMRRDAAQLLDTLQIDLDVDVLVKGLNISQKQSVQIAKALAEEARILILDEPTATYSSSESSHLLKLVRDCAANGISIIYISHHLDEIFNIFDRITVLRDGVKVATHEKGKVAESQIVSEMVGRDLSRFYAREKVEINYNSAVEFRNICGDEVQDISFNVHQGEIVGFAGMVGSGRTDLVKSIFGATPNASGAMIIEGKAISISNPAGAIEAGLSLLPEDRQHTGLILDHPLTWNVSLVGMANGSDRLIHERREQTRVAGYVEALNIKTPNLNQIVKNLSGGNQQKVVLAKWLYAEAKIIIFDEPTRGIDIGAKEEIYRLMIKLAQEGKYIVMVSSEMPELIAMCDRIFVMRQGRIMAELGQDEISEETILANSIGGAL